MDVRRGMVRQRDSKRAAEMRWCWVWQHFSLDALECNVMDKNLERFSSPKMPTRRPMSQMASHLIPHKHPPPTSRVGVRQCARIETSPPKHAPERTESRTPAMLAQKTRGAATIRLCGDPKENWSRLGDTRQEEKRRSCLYRIGRAHRRPTTAQAGRASTREKKKQERKVPVPPSQHTHTRRHTTALPS